MAFAPLPLCLVLAVGAAVEPACPTNDATCDKVTEPFHLLQVHSSIRQAAAAPVAMPELMGLEGKESSKAKAVAALPQTALQIGKKAKRPRRKASYYVAPQGETCSEGTLITEADVCQEAYDAIKVDYTAYPALRGLVTGSWDGVPVGCSLQFKPTATDDYVDRYGDQSPHLNAISSSSDSRLSSGEFLALCSGQPPESLFTEYVLMPANITHCPSEADVAEADCQEAYDTIKDDRTIYPAVRGLQKGSWNGLPLGCSLQFKSDYVTSNDDQSPHWNAISSSDYSRVYTGEFRVICKGPPPPSVYYMAPQGETCSEGTLITEADACQEAYDAIEVDYTVYPAQRGLVTGSWDGVPVACSLQFKPTTTDDYVDRYGDQSPHLNAISSSSDSRLSSGEFRALCWGEPPELLSQYVLMPANITSCPSERDVAEADCQEAYDAIKDDRTIYPAVRGLQKGSWNGLPLGCSLQFKSDYVTSNNDQSPHWNAISSSDYSRVYTGEFRVICKANADDDLLSELW